jgi:hypothetical protein
MKSLPRAFCLLLAATLAATLTGCSSWKVTQDINREATWLWQSYHPGKPSSLTVVWTDVVAYPPGDVPTRGFGARIFFNDDKSEDPMKVKGTLSVYAYDETNRDPKNVKPDRKYVFTSEQFTKHYVKSKMGPAYDVFIPWDDAGGPDKQISLIARFEPEKGDIVVSDQVKQLLHGTSTEMVVQQKTAKTPLSQLASAAGQAQRGTASSAVANMQDPQSSGVRSTSLEQAVVDGQDMSKPSMKTTTIPLPNQLGHSIPVSQQIVRPQIPQVNPIPGAAQTASRQFGQPGPIAQGVQTQTPALPKPVIQETTNQTQAGPQARSLSSRPRALGEPIAQLSRDRALLQQSPAVSPYRSPSQFSQTTPATGQEALDTRPATASAQW